MPSIRFCARAGEYALGALVVVALGACSRKDAVAPRGAPPPSEVGVVTVQPRTVPETFELVGQVEPSKRVEVRSRVEGIVEERPFTEGAVVTPGQVLYRLDRVRYQAAYESALARYTNAQRTLARIEPLVAKHAVAQQDVDNARTELDASKAALDNAKKDLDDTVVRAEIAGRVGRTRIDLGGRVTGSADLLTTIDQLDPAYVTFRPSSQQTLAWRSNARSRALIEPGSSLGVRLVLPDGSVFPRTGRLTFVAPALDSATGTQEFRATFENADRALVPGQFVRVQLSGFTRDNAVAIPQRGVQQGLGRQFVYVVGAGDSVVARDVRTGPWSGDLWIIDDGLKPGDRVVVDGLQKVGPGRVVKPVEAAPGADKPASTAVTKPGGKQ